MRVIDCGLSQPTNYPTECFAFLDDASFRRKDFKIGVLKRKLLFRLYSLRKTSDRVSTATTMLDRTFHLYINIRFLYIFETSLEGSRFAKRSVGLQGALPTGRRALSRF